MCVCSSLYNSAESNKYSAEELSIPDDDKVTSEDGKMILAKFKKLHEKAMALEKSHLARRRMQSKYLSQIRDLYGFDFHLGEYCILDDDQLGLTDGKMFCKMYCDAYDSLPFPFLRL